jgi:hypothetical protein
VGSEMCIRDRFWIVPAWRNSSDERDDFGHAPHEPDA